MKEDWEKWRERRLLLRLLYERRIKKKEKRTVTKLTFIMSTMHNSLPRIYYFNPYINPGIQVQFFCFTGKKAPSCNLHEVMGSSPERTWIRL